jgi:hypothetical protein
MAIAVAVPVNVSAKTYTFSNAKVISCNKSVKTALDSDSETWYKLKLNKKTKLKIEAKYDHGYIRIYNQDLEEIFFGDDYESKSDDYWKFSHELTVKKGTYYIKCSTGSSAADDIQFTIYNMNKPEVVTIKTVDKETGKISGKTVANAKVYVKIGNATYTGTSDSKGAFSVETTELTTGDEFKIWAKSQAKVKGKVLKYTVQ